MELGLAHFPTDYGMQPAELARRAEEGGFESLFLTEHTHIPVSRDSPYPGGGELPREYSHILDPFAALAAAATATERIRVGTGVCLIIERDPIVTAKEVATLDHISGGRFLFGVGAGWNIEEMENHGTDPGTRFRRMRESVEAMKAIWTQDEAEYHGRIVDFGPIWSCPNRCRSHIRRCSWADAARRCWTAWWRTATSGSRTGCGAPRSSASRSRSSSGARRPRGATASR
jgi:probable F420-dependent oxidoreductase